MKLSARNVLKGKVKKVNLGNVNAEIIIQLAGGEEVVAMITRNSAETLKLAEGKPVYAIVKASSIMVATED